MSEKRLIVGLGNPGRKYEYTRHNLGFLVCKMLGHKLKSKFEFSSFTNGVVAQSEFEAKEIELLAPMTYVNKSGHAVKEICKHKQYDLSEILVVCDDLNLAYGQMRIRPKGSDGGHNGLKSITRTLESDQYARLRMGVGRPGHQDDTVDYVLEEFTAQEKQSLEDYINEAAECCLAWVKEGNEKAMEIYNRKK